MFIEMPRGVQPHHGFPSSDCAMLSAMDARVVLSASITQATGPLVIVTPDGWELGEALVRACNNVLVSARLRPAQADTAPALIHQRQPLKFEARVIMFGDEAASAMSAAIQDGRFEEYADAYLTRLVRSARKGRFSLVSAQLELEDIDPLGFDEAHPEQVYRSWPGWPAGSESSRL